MNKELPHWLFNSGAPGKSLHTLQQNGLHLPCIPLARVIPQVQNYCLSLLSWTNPEAVAHQVNLPHISSPSHLATKVKETQSQTYMPVCHPKAHPWLLPAFISETRTPVGFGKYLALHHRKNHRQYCWGMLQHEVSAHNTKWLIMQVLTWWIQWLIDPMISFAHTMKLNVNSSLWVSACKAKKKSQHMNDNMSSVPCGWMNGDPLSIWGFVQS